MKQKINYSTAVSLLLDINDEYRDYVLEGHRLIGGEVGRNRILKNLKENEDKLFISDKDFHNFSGLCLGIEYQKDEKSLMLIPVDSAKLKEYLNLIAEKHFVDIKHCSEMNRL